MFVVGVFGSSSKSNNGKNVQRNILDFNVDCLEKKFDYLSLEQLVAFAQSCKELHKTVGEFYRANFVSKVRGQNGNICSGAMDIVINCFSRFVRSVHLEGGNLKFFEGNRFQSLKEIEFVDGRLSNTRLAINVLRNVEIVKFIYSTFEGDVYKAILHYCDKLKRLYVRDTDARGRHRNIFIGTSNKWLTKNFSALEHFELFSKEGQNSNQIIQFLKGNEKIHKFSTTIEFLIANLDAMSAAQIQLNVLSILHAHCYIDEEKFTKYLNKLKEMQKNGLFKRLYLHIYIVPRKYTYPRDLMKFVTKMHATISSQTFSLAPLINLEQLHLHSTSQIEDFDAALKQLRKLNYINFHKESVQKILSFVKSLPNLRSIQIETFEKGRYFNDNMLKLSVFNEERIKCKNASKLTIYANEDIYLATKKSLRGTTFHLVEIKRHESYGEFSDFTSYSW